MVLLQPVKKTANTTTGNILEKFKSQLQNVGKFFKIFLGNSNSNALGNTNSTFCKVLKALKEKQMESTLFTTLTNYIRGSKVNFLPEPDLQYKVKGNQGHYYSLEIIHPVQIELGIRSSKDSKC